MELLCMWTRHVFYPLQLKGNSEKNCSQLDYVQETPVLYTVAPVNFLSYSW